jgi:hypothetical protein
MPPYAPSTASTNGNLADRADAISPGPVDLSPTARTGTLIRAMLLLG